MNTSASDLTGPALDRTGVIVGVDGSEAADEAARAADVEAVSRHVPLTLLRAFDWPDGGVDGLPAGVDGRAVARRTAARGLVQIAPRRRPLRAIRDRVLTAAARKAHQRGVALTVVHTRRQLTEHATRSSAG